MVDLPVFALVGRCETTAPIGLATQEEQRKKYFSGSHKERKTNTNTETERTRPRRGERGLSLNAIASLVSRATVRLDDQSDNFLASLQELVPFIDVFDGRAGRFLEIGHTLGVGPDNDVLNEPIRVAG